MNTSVAIVRARPDYSDAERAVREAVGLIGGAGCFVKAGQSVLVKPNMLNTLGGETGMTTDRRITAAVAVLAREQGAEIVVGDSSGMRFYGDSDRVLQETGTRAACQEHGASVVSFDSCPSQKIDIPQARILHSCHVARPVLETDVLITVPKFKSHTLTKFSGALKNQIGCLPGGQKTMAHRLGSTPERFGHLIVDLYSVIRPRLAVMDAVIGLGGSWRPADRLAPGLVIAGEDPVAVDAVAARVGGLDPAEVPTLRLAAERGLGVIAMDSILFPGLHVDDIKPVPLVPHRFSSLLRSHAISVVSQPFLNRQKPKVRREACNGCAHCLEVCPVDAVTMEDGHPVFALEACIRCFCCHELCPKRAIAVDWGFPGNLFVRGRRISRQSFIRS